MRTEELNDLNSALDPEAIDELFANLGTTKIPSPPQQVAASTNHAPVTPRRRLSSQHQLARRSMPVRSEGIDWIGWAAKFLMFGGSVWLVILLLTSFSWSPFRDRPAAQPIRKMVTERRVVTRDIDKYDVGMRAMGQNPLLEQVEDAPEPDPETSRKLVLRMTKESGRLLLVKLLRSLDWIELAGAIEGGTFFLDLPEMGAVGDAYVEAILPCPPIEKGKGNVVTGVFAHEADPDTVILSVTFANGAHIKGVTDNHPFFSVNENDFVEIGKMHEGDYVKVNDGVTRITKIDSRFARPGEMLYNLETHNQHVFQVTTAGILVHNSCAEIAGKIARKFDTFECKQCANAMIDTLKAKGIRGHLIKLRAPNAHRGFIVSDRLGGKLISETGEHWGVRVGGKVYDNLNPNGVPFKEWFKDFHAHGGIQIEELVRF